MGSVGVKRLYLLIKIFSFDLTHRNSVAHPVVEQLKDDYITRNQPGFETLFRRASNVRPI